MSADAISSGGGGIKSSLNEAISSVNDFGKDTDKFLSDLTKTGDDGE